MVKISIPSTNPELQKQFLESPAMQKQFLQAIKNNKNINLNDEQYQQVNQYLNKLDVKEDEDAENRIYILRTI